MLDSLINQYLAVSSARPDVLFRRFLPQGYRCTALDSVASLEQVVFAKLHLGMIITLYDDLADHPEHRDFELLSHLYRLNVGSDSPVPSQLQGRGREIFELARFLFSSLSTTLKTFPHHALLEAVLRFDIEQFYACNRHSELMSVMPSIRNLYESRTLGPHNMGIVAAGTIDLMASPLFDVHELGSCREVFHLGQRLGRISNLVFTLERERSEGDTTNEIMICETLRSGSDHLSALLQEFTEKEQVIRSRNLKTFKTSRYADGLQQLHRLHASLEGRI